MIKLRKLRRNKRGATLDNFFALAQIFAFAIFILVAFKIWAEFTSEETSADLWDKTATGTSVKNNTQVAIDNMDWIFMIAYFGTHLGIIVMAYFLRSHPIVYVAGIFLVVVLVMIAAPLSNAWEDTTNEAELVSAAANMPLADFIMSRLPIFETVFAFLTLISLAAFARGEGYL